MVESMNAKSKKILLITMVVIFLVGMGLCLYPYVNGVRLSSQLHQQSKLFLSRQVRPDPGNTSPAHAADPLSELRQKAAAYNETIFEQNQALFCSAEAYERPAFLLSNYGLDSETFAVISIPAIDLEMPVYLGANAENLAVGAAHMTQTSLPIGGDNTNCVIAGHRGWKGADYFRRITSLKVGDQVIITNLWETLTYHVVEKKTIYSSESPDLYIQPGKDLLTLLTCDYGADGVKFRCLVICQRAADT